MSAPRSGNYYCYGSTDPQMVRKSFDRLSPIWQHLDSEEYKRFDEARNKIGQTSTTYGLAQKIRSAWVAHGLEVGTDNYSLGMAFAPLIQFLPFVRFAEELVLDARPAAILAYRGTERLWRTHVVCPYSQRRGEIHRKNGASGQNRVICVWFSVVRKLPRTVRVRHQCGLSLNRRLFSIKRTRARVGTGAVGKPSCVR
jgi:hypothetical protein